MFFVKCFQNKQMCFCLFFYLMGFKNLLANIKKITYWVNSEINSFIKVMVNKIIFYGEITVISDFNITCLAYLLGGCK